LREEDARPKIGRDAEDAEARRKYGKVRAALEESLRD